MGERFSPAFGRRSSSESSPSESAFEENPRLSYIGNALDFLHGEEGDEGAHWTELYKEVEPFATSLELSDNVRKVVRNFVKEKLSRVKEATPSIANIPDHNLLEALCNNYFENVGETEEQRRGVLLTVMASVVKRVETVAYKKIIEHASEEDLHKLALDTETRDLAVDLLDTSSKANPLFIRFLAYSQLSGEPPEDATAFALHGAKDGTLHTIADLFPKETNFLSQRFAKLAENGGAWEGKPGGREFKEYLAALSKVYAEKDIVEAQRLHEEMNAAYADAAIAGFPIVLTPGLEGMFKEPYIDPELRVSFVTEDSKVEYPQYDKAKNAMSESAHELGLDEFESAMRETPVVSAVAVGSFGVNLTFNAVAQERPFTLMYYNEQVRAYDKPYAELIQKHIGGVETNFDEEFAGKLSRMNTVLHEISHQVFMPGSPEAKRLGRRPHTVINEFKADTIYRALMPSMIEKEGVEGIKEEWAAASLGSALQYIKDDDDVEDPYVLSGTYILNTLLRTGAVVIEGQRVMIQNSSAYFDALKTAAEEVLALYRDESMDEKKAARWIQEKCAIDEQTEAFFEQLRADE